MSAAGAVPKEHAAKDLKFATIQETVSQIVIDLLYLTVIKCCL